MQWKLKASVVAVALALSPAAWAGVSSQAAEGNDTQGAADAGRLAADRAAATEPSTRESAKESLGWTYINGESSGSGSQVQEQQAAQPAAGNDTSDQAAAVQEEDGGRMSSGEGAAAQAKEDDDGRSTAAVPAQGDGAGQSAQGQGGPASAETAQSDDASGDMRGNDYTAGKENDQTTGSDSAATASEQAGTASSEAGNDSQSAQSEEPSAERSAQTGQDAGGAETWGGAYATLPEVAENDQPAQSPGPADDQTARADDTGSPDQSAMSEQGEASSAMTKDAGSGQTAQSGGTRSEEQAADSGVPAGMEGKVIVIVPRDWQGSLKDLVAALEATPDARDIVIVQQGEPQASNEDDDDEYFAERPAGEAQNEEDSGEQ